MTISCLAIQSAAVVTSFVEHMDCNKLVGFMKFLMIYNCAAILWANFQFRTSTSWSLDIENLKGGGSSTSRLRCQMKASPNKRVTWGWGQR